jgi:hypothetical protein
MYVISSHTEHSYYWCYCFNSSVFKVFMIILLINKKHIYSNPSSVKQIAVPLSSLIFTFVAVDLVTN